LRIAVYREAEIELVLGHGVPSGCPSATDCAAPPRSPRRPCPDPARGLGEAHCLRKARDGPGDAHLVGHLGSLPRARLAHVNHALGISGQHSTRGIDCLALPPHMIESVPASAPIARR